MRPHPTALINYGGGGGGGRQNWQDVLCRSRLDVKKTLCDLVAAMSIEGYPEEDVFAVQLGLEEAVDNAIKHGNRGDPAKHVHISYRVNTDTIQATIEDGGPGFDPDQVPDPTTPENLGKPHGRGLLLMRAFMTWVRFNQRGNRVTMCRHRSTS